MLHLRARIKEESNRQQPKDKNVNNAILFTLIDPRDSSISFTYPAGNSKERFKAFLVALYRANGSLASWLRDLMREGLMPIASVVDSGTYYEMVISEGVEYRRRLRHELVHKKAPQQPQKS